MSSHDAQHAAARSWLALDPDPVTRTELTGLLARAGAGDTLAGAELADCFGPRLAFGTAGLRGVLGPGPARMNRLLVAQVSVGLADYLLAQVPDAARRGVVIGHDARTNSRVFAEDTAAILAGRGVRVLLAPRPWPTPVTAYLVTAHGACAGVMVTASHNPPAYNGYKVYWGNGAQIIPPHDDGIAAAIDRVDLGAAAAALAAGRGRGAVIDLTEADHERYLAEVLARRVGAAAAPPVRVAYTPMHGVGTASVEPLLARAGVPVVTEPSQREPDAAFPTVAFPNPEEPGAMDRVLALARAEQAELVLANDPDADRLCVAVPDGERAGGWRVLTGDQVGVLLADYLLAHAPAGPRMVATTIVSSQMLGYLAAAAGATYRETLTGFKWIANAALGWEPTSGGRFVMGYEEALGYTVGDLVRDKDGVSAALAMADLAAWNRAQGRTVLGHLDDLYRRVGLFLTEQVSWNLPGADGLATIRAAMARFRAGPPATLAGAAVAEVVDLARGAGGLPPSDVLVFKVDGGQRVIMRPSGTEPKLKCYYEVRVTLGDGETIGAARTRGAAALAALRDEHQALLRR